MTLTEKLKVIRERCEKATSGPWDYRDGMGWCDLHLHPYLHNSETLLSNSARIMGEDKSHKQRCSDLHFIAHARTDIPKLLEVIEVLAGACEFYGDKGNWKSVTVEDRNKRFCIMIGADLEYFEHENQNSYCGKRSRQALTQANQLLKDANDE